MSRKPVKGRETYITLLLANNSAGMLQKKTGIPAAIISKVKRGVAKLGPESRRKLYNLYRRESYQKLKKAGMNPYEARKYRAYKPIMVQTTAQKVKAAIKILAKYYNRPQKKLAEGMSNTGKNPVEIYESAIKRWYEMNDSEKQNLPVPVFAHYDLENAQFIDPKGRLVTTPTPHVPDLPDPKKLWNDIWADESEDDREEEDYFND